MKIVVVAFFGAVVLGACNNGSEAKAPSMKAVDSAAAAAPDTIKAIAVDSVRR